MITPRRTGVILALAAASASVCSCGGDDDVVATSPDPILSCKAPERPRGPDRVRLEPAFPSMRVDGSVALVWPPASAAFGYVVAQSGVLWRFDARAETPPTAAVDLSEDVEYDGESGFLDVALHPRFPDVPDAFFSIVIRREGQLYSRIVRMRSPDGGATFDRGSEALILEVEQPFTNHKGGELAFGPDGLLYFGLGDGGGAGDPFGNGQNLEVLLGKMLRVDVDGAAPYAIPPDNPFAAGGGRPEIYAVGFRNPWRFAFDDANGDLWVGDVGQHEWEEIDRVTRGGNYGWSITEGTSCFAADTCARDGLIGPVAQYRNTGGASVIGGLVLRDADWTDLDGTYFYSDFSYGTISGISPDNSPVELGGGANGVAAWSKAPDGAIYAVHYGGDLSHLVAAPGGAATAAQDDTFPRTLSATGCVDVDHPRAAARGTAPYEVAVPFWSDGADKARFIAKGEEAIVVDGEGDWELPPGTVLVKSFFRDEKPVETRLLVRHQDGEWAGYGYAWRFDGSDADYVERGVEDVRQGEPWYFPSTHECNACHTSVAGRSLGITTGQLAVDDQLARFVDEGILERAPPGAALPAPGGAAPIADRARAYLDVNCSMCHQPQGQAGRAQLDLRYVTPFADTGLCGVEPRGGDLEIEDAVIIAPGDPARSVLSVRLHAVGDAHMPPIGITSVDEAGAAVVDEWIRSLDACP